MRSTEMLSYGSKCTNPGRPSASHYENKFMQQLSEMKQQSAQ